MADDSVVMSKDEISALKGTLFAQQQLLQELHNELEAEREASATAATEALSVILRLQGEKAVIHMEAEQYRRLSEEKMHYAEESLAIIEDIIYQKEMEVAALEFQVKAYRCQLLTVGCVDICPSETNRLKSPLQTDETLAWERDGSNRPEEIYDQVSDSDKIDSFIPGSIGSYWDHMRKLDIRVKEIAGANSTNSGRDTRLPSLQSSRMSAAESCDLPEVRLILPIQQAIMDEVDHSDNRVTVDNSCSIQDVLEVPQRHRHYLRIGKSRAKSQSKAGYQCNEILRREVAVKPNWLEKAWKSTYLEKSGYTLHDSPAAVVTPAASVIESLPESSTALESIAAERAAETTNREEEYEVLNEIKGQPNSLQDEIRSWKLKKSCTRNEPSLCSLIEAMLYFWM